MKAVFLGLSETPVTRLGDMWKPLTHYKARLLLIKNRIMNNTINSLAEEKRPCVPILPLQLLQVYFDLTSKNGKLINFTRRAYCYRSLCKVLKHQRQPYKARVIVDEPDAVLAEDELPHSPALSKALSYALASCTSNMAQISSASSKIQSNATPTSIFDEA